jgi:hypothetical protein
MVQFERHRGKSGTMLSSIRALLIVILTLCSRGVIARFVNLIDNNDCETPRRKGYIGKRERCRRRGDTRNPASISARDYIIIQE